jgi:hypothetical protein
MELICFKTVKNGRIMSKTAKWKMLQARFDLNILVTNLLSALTWERMSSGLQILPFTHLNINCLLFDKVNGSLYVWAVTLACSYQIFKSTKKMFYHIRNIGNTWNFLPSSILSKITLVLIFLISDIHILMN